MKEQNDMQGQEAEVCGPGCNCEGSGVSQRTKWVVSGVVALAAVVTVAVHVSRAGAADTQAKPQEYAVTIPAVAPVAAKPAAEDAGWGTPLKAMADLNQVATNTDAVFVVLPSSDAERMTVIRKEVSVAAATITGRGSRIGMFLFSQDSKEYAALAKQVGTPTVLVVYKGRGTAAVPDKQVTQESLLKAFVSASRPVSGCCPGGAGGSSCK